MNAPSIQISASQNSAMGNSPNRISGSGHVQSPLEEAKALDDIADNRNSAAQISAKGISPAINSNSPRISHSEEQNPPTYNKV